MRGFVKIYGDRLLDSTLWLECWQARLVFLGMLAAADSQGVVDIPSVEVLAHRLNLSVPDTRAGLDVLEAPDKNSRSEAEEGRRVVREGDHWRLVNYSKYREFRTSKQEQTRRRVARHRQSEKADTGVTQALHQQPVTEGNARNPPVTPVTQVSASDLSLSDLISSPSQLSDLSDAGVRAREGAEPMPDWGHAPPAPDDGWTAQQQELVFRAMFERSQATIANMAGRRVASFHREVLRTAELQERDPGELFRDAVTRWLATGLEEAARRAPYACLQQSWGDLTSRAEKAAPRGARGRPARTVGTTGKDFADEPSVEEQLARFGLKVGDT